MPFCRLSLRARVRIALQLGGGAGELAEVLLADLAHAQILGADSRLLGEDSGRQLVSGHFEAEQGYSSAGALAGLNALLLFA
jgi:hypothetical protein